MSLKMRFGVVFFMIMTSVMHPSQWMGVCTSQKPQEWTSKKGFLWSGSEGVDHVAIEVLQHDVANRGSRRPGTSIGNLVAF